MDFKGIFLTICFVALITGLFKMLIPSGSFKSQISLLVACLFIVSVISAISNSEFAVDIDFSGEKIPVVDFSEEISDTAKKKVEAAAKSEVTALLQQNGIVPEKIYVIVHISGMYSITINEIELVFSSDTDEKTSLKGVQLVQEKVGDGIKVKSSVS